MVFGKPRSSCRIYVVLVLNVFVAKLVDALPLKGAIILGAEISGLQTASFTGLVIAKTDL